MRLYILIAVWLVAPASAFADMAFSQPYRWFAYNEEVAQLRAEPKSSMTSDSDFRLIDQFVRSTMSRADLDGESVEAIALYLDNREYEMAFEGLFLELIKTGKTIKINTSECMSMARQLRLDKETVFDYQFWPKFEAYLQN